MFRNHLKVAFRYLLRHKSYTATNLLGLSVGIACCLLLALFVRSEWSFDRFHEKSGRIYRAWLQEHYKGEVFTNTVTPIPLGPVVKEGVPDVAAYCRVAALRPFVRNGATVLSGDVNMVDSNFFDLFDFPFVEGNPRALHAPQAILLTQSAAKRFFGATPPMGKELELRLGEDTVLFTVAGLLKDPPLESSIRFEMLISFAQAPHLWSANTRTSAWSNVAVETYFLLPPGATPEPVQARIASVLNPLVKATYKPGEYNVRLQRLTDIHLDNSLPEGNQPVSDPKYAYILATIGLLVLLIACINFVTLAIGRSATRALEVGVRKVLGAARPQLLAQYWGEALLLTLMAFVLGAGLAAVALKPFSALANRALVPRLDATTLALCGGIIAVIALIAGVYPALVLSRFRPIQVLKGRLQAGGNVGLFRKALITGQFLASIVMIICTVVVGRQLQYLRSKDLGFNREQLVVLPTNQPRLEGNALAARYRVELEKLPFVQQTSVSLYSMAEAGWMSLGYSEEGGRFRSFSFNAVDADFVAAHGVQLVAGRNFSKTNPADSGFVLVNEAFVKAFGLKDPVGAKLPYKYGERILGVVKDFHFESLHTAIGPAVMALRPDSIFRASSDVSYATPPRPRLTVRLGAGDHGAHLAALQAAWKRVAGDQEFAYRFLDEALNSAYEQEGRLGTVVRWASGLSVFIACMGLFGLATLVVVRRTREIGIRKVLGAEVGSIVTLLSKDFVLLVGLAALGGFPLAWWMLSKWLQDFAYRIDIPLWVFGAAAGATIVIALATVCLQTVRAALANPVRSLRSE
ncbi:ABC transporter permease [Flaviaesturariibacter amylovorans]|uniref:ABC transporter permease n=1 Tax=Flaviaesturariibacter amylovorans TaxID=1084520 RepID=A0ABP8GJ33_9BACT